ncbi:MAG: ATP synthase F1 subunit epsilon [Planctomycetes bacterium]|nr:ATP synthase F1 subunit epsilon [Planctomycetota bacterium]
MSTLTSELHCMVITPEEQVVDTRAFDVVLPAFDGLRGVLPGHAPMMCRMGTGLLRYHDQKNKLQTVFVDGGFGHVQDNEVSILAPGALRPGDLTIEEAREQLKQAEAMEVSTEEEVEGRGNAIHRARQLLMLVENKS